MVKSGNLRLFQLSIVQLNVVEIVGQSRRVHRWRCPHQIAQNFLKFAHFGVTALSVTEEHHPHFVENRQTDAQIGSELMET